MGPRARSSYGPGITLSCIHGNAPYFVTCRQAKRNQAVGKVTYMDILQLSRRQKHINVSGGTV